MRELITIEQLSKRTGFSKSTLYRKLKELDRATQKHNIVKKSGKKTLYNATSLIGLLQKDTNDTPNERAFERGERPIESENSKIKSSKYIERIEKELDNYKKLLDEKNEFIKDLNLQLSAKEERHDTIIMTMTKQLESLNERILLEDKTIKEPEGFFRNYSPSINQAFIFVILVIVYIKILYI